MHEEPPDSGRRSGASIGRAVGTAKRSYNSATSPPYYGHRGSKGKHSPVACLLYWLAHHQSRGSSPIPRSMLARAAAVVVASLLAAASFHPLGSSRVSRAAAAPMTTEFSITTQASNPVGITSGPDGALWFTEFSSNKVGRISISGTVTELAAPQSCYGGPQGITGGPDGALWLTQNQGNDIGRLTTTGVGNVYTIHTTFGGPCGQPLG